MAVVTDDAPLPYEKARSTILNELYSANAELHADYIKLFAKEIEQFADFTARAVDAWLPMDGEPMGPERAYVTGLANLAIYLHIDSMKLFITGHTIAAGNVFRQVLETIALTLLCSSHQLRYLKDFIAGDYKTHRAIPDVMAHAQELRLKEDGLNALKQSQNWYHQYSHATQLTLAIPMVSGGEGGNFVGANFDPGKVEQYSKEMQGRLGLSRVFVSFMEAVKANVAKWPQIAHVSTISIVAEP
jgi:hypothetical protein